jgi:hypothetical protein
MFSSVRFVALGVVFSAALTACPKKTSSDGQPGAPDAKAGPVAPKITESCDVAGLLGFCLDYTKTDVMMHRTLCEGFKGKFAEAPCSKDRVVGSCEMLEDGDIKRYYEKLGAKDVGFTPDKAKENCEGVALKGRFVPRAP